MHNLHKVARKAGGAFLLRSFFLLPVSFFLFHVSFAQGAVLKYKPVPGGYETRNGEGEFNRPLYGWHGGDVVARSAACERIRVVSREPQRDLKRTSAPRPMPQSAPPAFQ